MWKKTLISIVCMFSSSFALAQYTAAAPTTNQPNGYTDSGTPIITTVTDAKKAADEATVILEGYITRRIDNDDRYEFKDKTGIIIVEIDQDNWRAPVSNKTKVRLYGEVDKNLIGKTEIDVDHVEILSK